MAVDQDSDETGRVIRRLWLHIKALYILLISVTLASVVVFLLCFGELQKLQTSGLKGRKHQRMLPEEIIARFDPETLSLNASAADATDFVPENDEEDDILLENSSSSFPDFSPPTNPTPPPQQNEDRHRRRSNLRRHLKDNEEDDDGPPQNPPSPPPSLPPVKEDRRNLPTSGDAGEETATGRDNWVWLTSYSRIPVGICPLYVPESCVR